MGKIRIGVLAILFSSLAIQGGWGQDYTNFANDGYLSQFSMQAFNQSVKHRMQVARVAFYGDVEAPPSQRYVESNVAGGANCPTFTVWSDGYFAWGKQKTDVNGYKFHLGGPSLGVDWSNGPFTIGLASTYNWGKIKAREFSHERKTRTFGLTLYSQINYERFYANAQVSYGRNRFKSRRWTVDGLNLGDDASAKYHSNAWNGEIEIGTRLNWCNFVFEPHIGVNYFYDRRKAFGEARPDGTVNQFSQRNYHSLEMPLGLDVSYSQGLFNSLLVPRLSFAWVPQFKRKYGKADTFAGDIRESVKRARHGFELGAGVDFKMFKSVSAHIDYTVNMRAKAYEHMLSAGIGMSF